MKEVVSNEINKAWEFIKKKYDFLNEFYFNPKGSADGLVMYEGGTSLIDKIITINYETYGNEFDNSEIVIPLINLFHECGHVCIDEYRRKKSKELDAFFLENSYLAEQIFQFYYHDNYKLNPCECVAQYIGIREAYEYFNENGYEKDAAQFICDYTNWRVKSGSELIDSCINKYIRYKSVSKIYDDFEKSFLHKIYAKRSLDETTLCKLINETRALWKNFDENKEKIDFNIKHFDDRCGNNDEIKKRIKKITKAKTGALQDFYICKDGGEEFFGFNIYCRRHGEEDCIKLNRKDISLLELYNRIKEL